MGSLEASVIVCVIAALLFTPVDVDAKAVIKKRDTSQDCTSLTPPAPCGWKVLYIDSETFTFVYDYIRAECDCPVWMYCHRAEFNSSIPAYVYRCVDVPENTGHTD